MKNFRIKELMVAIYPSGSDISLSPCDGPTGKCPASSPSCDGPTGKCPASMPSCDGPTGKCPASIPSCDGPTGKCPASAPGCYGPTGKCPASSSEKDDYSISFVKEQEELASLKQTLAAMQAAKKAA